MLRGTILFPIVWVKRLHGWKKAHYAPLPCQSTRVTVCSQFCAWMGPLISKLCSHWAIMCHLVVQRNLWHWRAACWIEYSPSMYVKWTLLQWEQGQSGNMLVIVVSCTQSLNTATVHFCWAHCCVIYCTVAQTPFPATSTPGLHIFSLMTGLIPPTPPHPPLSPWACKLCTGSTTFCWDAHRQVVCVLWPYKVADVLEHWRLEAGCGYGSAHRN